MGKLQDTESLLKLVPPQEHRTYLLQYQTRIIVITYNLCTGIDMVQCNNIIAFYT